MMRLLNGTELAGYIKERQAKQVRSLRQAHEITPKLAIVVTINDPATHTYIKVKKQYGADILIDVDIHSVSQQNVKETITSLNNDESVHGIIVQLPLQEKSETDEILALVNPEKDVDGLGPNPDYEPATPMAIMWLLTGYNIDLLGKGVLLVGQGRLVGKPLKKLLVNSGIEPAVADVKTKDLSGEVGKADIVITATGVKWLIKPEMFKDRAVVVDAGVASEGQETFGDVDPAVYESRDDLTITPFKGGVGPLTVCALFDNVIRAAQARIES